MFAILGFIMIFVSPSRQSTENRPDHIWNCLLALLPTLECTHGWKELETYNAYLERSDSLSAHVEPPRLCYFVEAQLHCLLGLEKEPDRTRFFLDKLQSRRSKAMYWFAVE